MQTARHPAQKNPTKNKEARSVVQFVGSMEVSLELNQKKSAQKFGALTRIIDSARKGSWSQGETGINRDGQESKSMRNPLRVARGRHFGN